MSRGIRYTYAMTHTNKGKEYLYYFVSKLNIFDLPLLIDIAVALHIKLQRGDGLGVRQLPLYNLDNILR
jgi:hypothetical protein